MHNKKLNQIKIGALLNYIQLFIGFIISISITPFIVRGLGQSQYGIYSLSQTTSSYLSLLTLGIGGAFLNFNTKYRINNDEFGEKKLNATFLIFYLIISFVVLITGILISFFSDSMFGASMSNSEIKCLKIVIFINALNIALSLPFTVFSMNINAYEKFIFAKAVNILNTIALPLIKLPVVLLGWGAIGATITITFVNLIVNIILMLYCIFKLKIGFIFAKLDKKLTFQIFSFSFFIFLNQLIDMINWNVDKIILGVVGGTSMVAIYTIGATFNTYTTQFSTAVSSVLSPRVYKLVKNDDGMKKIDDLFIKTGRIQFILISFVISSFIFFGKSFIVNIYADESYSDSYYIAILLLVPLIIPLIQNIGLDIQRAMNKHKFRSVVYAIIAFVNLGISIPLAMKLGGIGSAIGTCLSLLIGNGLIMNIYYYKVIKLDVLRFWKNILSFIPSLIIPVSLGIVILLFVDTSNTWVFIAYAFLYTIVFFLSLFLFGCNNFERNLVLAPLKNITGKSNE